ALFATGPPPHSDVNYPDWLCGYSVALLFHFFPVKAGTLVTLICVAEAPLLPVQKCPLLGSMHWQESLHPTARTPRVRGLSCRYHTSFLVPASTRTQVRGSE